MKNTLYTVLFVLAVSSCITVSAQDKNMHQVWGGTITTDQSLDLSRNVVKGKHILENAEKKTLKVGVNPAAYAPSEEENFLRHLAVELHELNPDYAIQLRDIADQIAQLRMHDLVTFKKYFQSEVEQFARTPKVEQFARTPNYTIADLSDKPAADLGEDDDKLYDIQNESDTE